MIIISWIIFWVYLILVSSKYSKSSMFYELTNNLEKIYTIQHNHLTLEFFGPQFGNKSLVNFVFNENPSSMLQQNVSLYTNYFHWILNEFNGPI